MTRQQCADEAKYFFDSFVVEHEYGWYNIEQSLKIVVEQQKNKYEGLICVLKSVIEEMTLSLILKELPIAHILLSLFIFKSRYFLATKEYTKFVDELEIDMGDIPKSCQHCDIEQEIKNVISYQTLQPVKFPELKMYFINAFKNLWKRLHSVSQSALLDNTFDFEMNPYVDEKSEKRITNIEQFYEQLKKSVDAKERQTMYEFFFRQIMDLFPDCVWGRFLKGDIEFLLNALMTVQLTIRCKQMYDEEKTKKTFTLGRRLDVVLIENSAFIVDIDEMSQIIHYPQSFVKRQINNYFISCQIFFGTTSTTKIVDNISTTTTKRNCYSVCLDSSVFYCLFGNEPKHQKSTLLLLEEIRKKV